MAEIKQQFQNLTPSELRISRERDTLTVRFGDTAYAIPAELLRVSSPSAEVRGHGHGERKLVSGKRNVRISGVEPVGRYAVRIVFDDGHDTGLYQWGYLAQLGAEKSERMAAYEAELRAAGKSRGDE